MWQNPHRSQRDHLLSSALHLEPRIWASPVNHEIPNRRLPSTQCWGFIRKGLCDLGHNSKAFLMATDDLLNDICLLTAMMEWTAQTRAAVFQAPRREKTDSSSVCRKQASEKTSTSHLQFLGATVVESYQPPNFPIQLNRTLLERENKQVRQTVKCYIFTGMYPHVQTLTYWSYCGIWLVIPQ